MTYASFLKRTTAYLIDAFIYGILSSIIVNMISFFMALFLGVLSHQQEPPLSAILLITTVSLLIHITCYVLYYVWPESSAWQATLGKRLLGLQVTDLQGQRIGFWHSLGRNMGMILSTLLLGVGYLTCLWTEKKQCLHDSLANCLVVDTNPDDKKGCLVGVVIGFVALLIGTLVLGIIAAIALPGYMQALEKARAKEGAAQVKVIQNLQRAYYTEHNSYAKTWTELSFAPCQAEQTASCVVPSFTLELEEQGIAA